MMQANWSLILNVLLLVGVIIAIGRLMKARRQSLSSSIYQPSLKSSEKSSYDTEPFHDDIIAVRKVKINDGYVSEEEEQDSWSSQPQLMPQQEVHHEVKKDPNPKGSSTIMMFLLAKQNRQFAGYELLQTVLASGLRFGDGNLFHRHQHANGQGPVLCSLAAATATGVFDLQNIGAFSVRGLCIYMHASQNPNIDAERFSIMLETARQLREGLDAYLLDEERKPLTNERLARYYHRLNIDPAARESITA